MKKFQGTMLPGGVAMNGQQIFEEASQEIAAMREEMITKYSLPSTMFIGIEKCLNQHALGTSVEKLFVANTNSRLGKVSFLVRKNLIQKWMDREE